MMKIAAELDRELAGFLPKQQIGRATSDVIVANPLNSSTRVQVRFGENTTDEGEVHAHLGKAWTWIDQRKHFFENIPQEYDVRFDKLASIAQKYGLEIIH